MNLTRVLNCMADCHAALRLAGFTPEQAQRILTVAARDAVDAIPTKPYPDYKDNTHDNRNSNDYEQGHRHPSGKPGQPSDPE